MLVFIFDLIKWYSIVNIKPNMIDKLNRGEMGEISLIGCYGYSPAVIGTSDNLCKTWLDVAQELVLGSSHVTPARFI